MFTHTYIYIYVYIYIYIHIYICTYRELVSHHRAGAVAAAQLPSPFRETRRCLQRDRAPPAEWVQHVARRAHLPLGFGRQLDGVRVR